MTIIQAQPLKQFGISGPASALDNEVPIFDGITGKKMKAATGIICPSSGRLKMSSTAPYLTLHNTTHEDTDYGRESELIFKGEQSGGEETTLGIIQVAHDGTSDDQKGIMSFKVNDGNDADAPGTAMTIDSARNVGIGKTNPTTKLDVFGSGIASNNTGAGALLRVNRTDGRIAVLLAGGSGTGFKFDENGTFAIEPLPRATLEGTGFPAFTKGFQVDGNGNVYLNTNQLYNKQSTGNIGIDTTDPSAKLDINSDIIRLRTAKTPASAGAAGNQGDECWDANYHYRCVATNTWKRTALTTW